MEKINYKTYKTPSDYLKLPVGETVIRIVSAGGIRYLHSMRTARGFVPLGECQGVDCEHCAKKNKPKRKWTWIAFNRDTEEVAVFDAGKILGDGICRLAQKLDKDPMEFDIKIDATGEKLKRRYKDVVEKKGLDPLTDEQQKEITIAKKRLITKYF